MANLKQAVSNVVDAVVAVEGDFKITILQSTQQQLKDKNIGKIEIIQVARVQYLQKETDSSNFDLYDVIQIAGPFELSFTAMEQIDPF